MEGDKKIAIIAHSIPCLHTAEFYH